MPRRSRNRSSWSATTPRRTVALVVVSFILCSSAGAAVAPEVLGLGLVWGASLLARRRASLRHTHGVRASTVLAALANAMLLLVAVDGVSWEALRTE